MHPTTSDPRAVRRGRNRQAGFTVVELLVVVFILAILAAVAMPAATVDTDRKLDTFQLELQDAIDHAQSLAYHTGAKYGVKFDVAGQWFAVMNEVGVPVTDPLTKGPYIVFIDRPDQPAGVRLEYCVYGLRPIAPFNDKGVLEKAGVVRISADGVLRNLTMNTATARFEEAPIEG